MRKNRRKFSDEFRADAIAMVRDQGRSITETARALDLGQTVLRRWLDKTQAPASGAANEGQNMSADQQISTLQRELAQSKRECEVLKKSIACFAKDMPL